MPYTQLAWNVDSIGEAAGQAWSALKRDGQLAVAELEKRVDAPKQLVYMALGWLAREGKLAMSQDKRTIRVWLTE